MSKLSISFTLGKASTGNANIEHNNREFISNNVDVSRIVDNIIYVREDIHDVYDELFGEALQEYNDKQTRKDRKIYDYFQHIENDKRRETHYEILVQFGDSNNAGVGSENGQLATKMLDEYIRQFQERNPNLRNSLITALDYFIASENEIGETVSSKQATRLKTKILTHGRAFDYEGDANASIYFYGVEPAVIMKLLTIYINRGEEIIPTDYFSQLKKRRNKNAV